MAQTPLNHIPLLENFLKFAGRKFKNLLISNVPKQPLNHPPWGNTHIVSPNIKVTFNQENKYMMVCMSPLKSGL